MAARGRADGEGNEAGHAAAAGPRRSRGRAQVRPRGRPRRARAREREAYGRARRGRCGREGAARGSRDRRRRNGARDRRRAGGSRDRDRRGACRPRHTRRGRRGAGEGGLPGARLLRDARGAARCAARGCADGDPGGEGSRDRRRVRACPRARLGRARRDRSGACDGARIARAGSRRGYRTARRSSFGPR